MLKQPGAKQLLNSLKVSVEWVNRIVVRQCEDNYIVVEGNTRTACLKTAEILNINSETPIPVLIATIEPDETEEQYKESLKRLQGIANVMVVKDWLPVAKGHHLYDMFISKKEADPESTNRQIGQSIALQLGMSFDEVMKFVRGYVYYSTIKEESEPLGEREWSFIEGLDKNEATRAFLGFNKTKLEFDWQNNNESLDSDLEDEIEEKRARLAKFPKFLKNQCSLSSPDFRKEFPQLLTRENAAELYDELADGQKQWKEVFSSPETPADPKTVWLNHLSNINETLKQFPLMADWVTDGEIQSKFLKLKELIEKMSTSITPES